MTRLKTLQPAPTVRFEVATEPTSTAEMAALNCLRAEIPSLPIAADSYPITARWFVSSSTIDIFRLALPAQMEARNVKA
jgi:hypothetical protein